MTSIILKKRKLCEAIEENLRITPATYESKRYVDESGKYRQLYESLIPQLKALFPEHNDAFLAETLKYHKNDILTTIEYLKYQRPQTNEMSPRNSPGKLDFDILEIMESLSTCGGNHQIYDILSSFKNKLVGNHGSKNQKSQAENSVLRKAFKIQNKVMNDEIDKRKKSENVLTSLAKELERSQAIGAMISMKLDQLERSCEQNLMNNRFS